MKKLFAGLTIIGLMLPVGAALAKDNGVGVSGSGNVNAGARAGVDLDLLRANAGANANANADVRSDDQDEDQDDDRGSATSSERNKGQRGEAERSEHASSSTRENEDANDEHPAWGSKGGLAGFLRWILGLPATTTVGEIRADIQATSSTRTSDSSSQGLGFWARFFSFFGFGNSEE